jgi:hypothetical protein
MKVLPLLAAATLCVLATAVSAQATRTWVSGVGDDANPCSRTAPCKTFPGAISKTAAGGEISVLDPGGFGTVTIAKAITINGDGTLAGILGAGVTGIIVNTSGTVILRNLSLHGAQTGQAAIRHIGTGPLLVKNVRITGFGASSKPSIELAPTGALDVTLTDVEITGCVSSSDGILFNGAGGAIKATLERVQVAKCGAGLNVGTGATVSGTTAALPQPTGAAVPGRRAKRCSTTRCCSSSTAGAGGATATVADTTLLDDNTTVCAASGGASIISFGNNRIGTACVVTGASLR